MTWPSLFVGKPARLKKQLMRPPKAVVLYTFDTPGASPRQSPLLPKSAVKSLF
jgi:hypothetical protein